MKGINDIGQTVQQHTQKVVQMHLFARNFACQLEQKIVEKMLLVHFERSQGIERSTTVKMIKENV